MNNNVNIGDCFYSSSREVTLQILAFSSRGIELNTTVFTTVKHGVWAKVI